MLVRQSEPMFVALIVVELACALRCCIKCVAGLEDSQDFVKLL
jgi:hypothetical protein